MKTKNVTHSKVKNPGVLFELLVRQITVDTLEGKDNSPAMSLMRKYFNQNTELGKELQMYRSFFELNRLTEVKAAQFVDLVSEQRKKLDEKKLAVEKYELIKEVRTNYDLEKFLSVKIPSYKVYASIYKTFLAENHNFNVANIHDVASSRFTLIEYLMRDTKKKTGKTESDILEVYKNLPEDERLLTYKSALDKFNQKYSNLNAKQKMLLREYVSSVSNSDKFDNYIRSEVDPLKKELTSLSSKETDKVLQIKLHEVVQQLEAIKTKKNIHDNELTAVMLAYQIAEELRTA